MRGIGIVIGIALTAAAALAQAPASRPAAVTRDEITQSIERGKLFLFAEQEKGAWAGELTPQTVLLGLAVATGGNDQQCQTPLANLLKAEKVDLPTACLRLQVCDALWRPREPSIREDGKLILDSTATDGPAGGMVGRTAGVRPRITADVDLRLSAQAVFAMAACENQGGELPAEYWKAVQAGWRNAQDPAGCWPAGQGDLAMTAAGAAILLLAEDYLEYNRGVDCAPVAADPHLDAAYKWIGQHINDPLDARGIFDLARLGRLTGYKRFGGVDWRDQRIRQLLASQQPNSGGWKSVEETAYAIAVLEGGRWPVAISKLSYESAGKEAKWNRRPRDVPNLVEHFIDPELCGLGYRWQVVSLRGPVSDMSESPVLCICGGEELKLTEEDESKLREYIENGGLVFGNADCASKAFAESFQKLGTKLFPDYSFRELPKEHVIYTRQQFPRETWRDPPRVLAMSNGVRELMVIAPDVDLGRAWQMRTTKTRREQFQLPMDVFTYAFHARWRDLWTTQGLAIDPAVKAQQTLRIARLRYTGNWDPEPGGWRRLGIWMHNEHKVDVSVEVVELGAGSAGGPARSGNAAGDSRAPGKLGDFRLAHLTGTGKLKLSPEQRKELAVFVEKGGTLIVDAAGGDAEFAASAEAELAAVWPDTKLAELDPADPVYCEAGAIKNIFRRYSRSAVEDTRRPHVKAISIAGRNAVYFSPHDISSALVGCEHDGIVGYTPAYGMELMSGMLLRFAP